MFLISLFKLKWQKMLSKFMWRGVGPSFESLSHLDFNFIAVSPVLMKSFFSLLCLLLMTCKKEILNIFVVLTIYCRAYLIFSGQKQVFKGEVPDRSASHCTIKENTWKYVNKEWMGRFNATVSWLLLLLYLKHLCQFLHVIYHQCCLLLYIEMNEICVKVNVFCFGVNIS